MVVGTPGGSRIITAVLLTILNVIDYGMDMQEAVDAPRFHQQWLPEATNVEDVRAEPGHAQASSSAWGTSSRCRSRRITSRRFSSARRRSAASRSARTASTAAIDPRRNTGLALGY